MSTFYIVFYFIAFIFLQFKAYWSGYDKGIKVANDAMVEKMALELIKRRIK